MTHQVCSLCGSSRTALMVTRNTRALVCSNVAECSARVTGGIAERTHEDGSSFVASPATHEAYAASIAPTADEPIDYGKSRYQNATAERAYAVVLDGFSENAIYGADDLVAFDLVTTDEDGAVILRYDSQGFISIETDQRSADAAGTADSHGHFGRKRVLCHFDFLAREYAIDDDEENA